MTEVKQKRTRTCVGCGKQSDKVRLHRIVRTADGVKYDASGRMAGRGAYVCSDACLDNAISSRKLQRALRCSIEGSEADQVRADMATSSALTR